VMVIYEGVGRSFKLQGSSFKLQGSSFKLQGSSFKLQGSSFKLQGSKILKKYKIKKPYFIYVGNVYPFKNVYLLLQAIKYLNDLNHLKNNIQLVIVCSRDVFWKRLERQVKKLGLGKEVVMPGQLSDKDLSILLKKASAFVTASLMEGFGLPGLEALSTGCPVLAARAGSLPEIYGEAAIYFDPQNVNDLVGKMKKVLQLNKNERNIIIKKGRKQSKKYSWEKTAEETLGTYKGIFAELA